MKYQQRPVDAFQWDGEASSALKQFVMPASVPYPPSSAGEIRVVLQEWPIPRSVSLAPGDWVVRHSNEKLSVCSDRTFRELYVEAKEAKATPKGNRLKPLYDQEITIYRKVNCDGILLNPVGVGAIAAAIRNDYGIDIDHAYFPNLAEPCVWQIGTFKIVVVDRDTNEHAAMMLYIETC